MKDTFNNEILISGRGSNYAPAGDQEGIRWPLPLLLAVGLHLFVMAMILWGPFISKPRKEEVVSIDLVSIGSQIAAPPGPSSAGPPTPKPTPPAPKSASPAPPPPAPTPPPREAAVPIPVPPPKPVVAEKTPQPKPVEVEKPPTPATPREVVSLEPVKKKELVKKEVKEKDTKVEEKDLTSAIADIKKKVEKDTKTKVEEKDLTSAIADIKKKVEKDTKTKVEEKDLTSAIAIIQKRIEAERAGKMADDKAKRAVDLLRGQLASGQGTSEQESSESHGGAGGTASSPGGGGGGGTPTALGQYYAQLISHLRQFYQLPPGHNFEPGLKATIKITIAKDGKLQEISFEKNSGNVYFDRFVERVFKNASPVPPLPPVLGVESLGPLGINCYPNELI